VRMFFDSSAFAKRYIDEPGSQAVDALCEEATELALSVVCVPEIISALNRCARDGSLSRPQYQEAKRRLAEDVEDAVIINLTPPVVAGCTAILEESPVRAVDALHVACAVAWEAELFVSADKRQIAAANKAGLHARLV
jgi:uncharacterized protein